MLAIPRLPQEGALPLELGSDLCLQGIRLVGTHTVVGVPARGFIAIKIPAQLHEFSNRNVREVVRL
jgi:hypothetical protein